MGSRLNLPLDDADSEGLSALAMEADVARVGWVRGAIRTALADDEVARKIAANVDQVHHGGRRPGAGRPTKTDDNEWAQPRP